MSSNTQVKKAGGKGGRTQRELVMVPKSNFPVLDDHKKFLLDGKKDKVKQLVKIQIDFYPGGNQEATYHMEVPDDDGELAVVQMTTSEFDTWQRQQTADGEQERRMEAAKGFGEKLHRRALFRVLDDEPEYLRGLMARKFPKIAEKLLNYTQRELAEKKLNTADAILDFWSKVSESSAQEMDEFQQGVLEDADERWSARVVRLCNERFIARQAAALKKVQKAASKTLPPGAKWADDGPDKSQEPKTPAAGWHGLLGKHVSPLGNLGEVGRKPPPIPAAAKGGVGKIPPSTPSVTNGAQNAPQAEEEEEEENPLRKEAPRAKD